MHLPISNTLTILIKQFLSENLANCLELIKDNITDINKFTLELYLNEDKLFKNFLPIITSKIVAETQCVIVLKKLEELRTSNVDILIKNSVVVNKLIDKILGNVENPVVLKRSLEFMTQVFMSTSLIVNSKVPDF